MKVLVIYTGGTIGMVKDAKSDVLVPGGVTPIVTFLEKEGLIDSVTVLSFTTAIDSSDFNKEHYKTLATLISDNYAEFDSFLVLMGTDTMAYVSSMLSFGIEGLQKPIVFTGGQYPLFIEDSDSTYNLKEALLGLLNGDFSAEVGIYFSGKWHRAVSTTKMSSTDLDAFFDHKRDKEYLLNPLENFRIFKELSSNVFVVKLTPFFNEEYLLSIFSKNNPSGIVLEGFGTGNLPNFSSELKKVITEKINEGYKIAVVSQCFKGNVAVGKYESSLAIEELGLLSCGSITTESAVSKLLYLFEKKLNIQEFRHLFEDSLRGE